MKKKEPIKIKIEIPTRKPATHDMWVWVDEANNTSNQLYKQTNDLKALKNDLADAVIQFGKALKYAEEKIKKVEEEVKYKTDKNFRSNEEFRSKFGVERYGVDWSKRV